ncbi:MAG: hypothetical protein L0Z50_05440 [Verrucomicrobiales bacterium]|nr:hypothetical protein [Verrucomicrobiales bacterium]
METLNRRTRKKAEPPSLRAANDQGLLQSSLVEILPTQVGVEVTLAPGIDLAPKIIALIDLDHNGVFSDLESEAWSELFMARQSVTVDGQSLPLELKSVRASPLAEMTGGHAQIVVHYTAELGSLARGSRTIVCANRYEPIPCAYQCNGLVPKAPGVRIASHRRDERQRELTLAVEFSNPPAAATQTAAPVSSIPHTPPAALGWFVGLSLAAIGLIAACRWLFANAGERRTR